MLFSSMFFIWCFLPTVLIVNYAIEACYHKKNKVYVQNIFLLIASLLFYAWGGLSYLLIMISSIVINFVGGFLVSLNRESIIKRRLLLFLIIAANLIMLFYFKYFNMLLAIIEASVDNHSFSSTMKAILFLERTYTINIKDVVLPIGISFFTFQAMSYVVDVYKNKARPQTNIVNFALYVSLFPQLIAGPIVKYSDISNQLLKRQSNILTFYYGQRRFIYGLAKKVIIANTFAEIADDIWAMPTNNIGCSVAWLGAISYTIQIYYDFSGYSDMAIGIGKMLGFDFKENFDYPYTSCSIIEFWRRWHISLSSWFKEYVYIPLGGNRKGDKRTYLNILIVFLLTGIWHGANFTFIVWGVYYAVLQIIERVFLKKFFKNNSFRFIKWFYSIIAVIIGWVYFRSDSIIQANTYISQMFCFSMKSNSIFSYLSLKSIIIGIIAVLFSGFIQRKYKEKFLRIRNNGAIMACEQLFQIALFILCVFMLVGGSYNPFIYFRF